MTASANTPLRSVPDAGRQIVVDPDIEYELSSGIASLECISDMLAPVKDGVDLHLVDRASLSYLIAVVHERLKGALTKAHIL